MTPIVLLAALLAPPAADAHPFSKEEWSMRSSVKLTDRYLQAAMVLEIPVPVVLRDLDRRKGPRKEPSRAQVRAHDKAVWEAMAEGLTIAVDGEPLDVTFRAMKHPMNGKAAEGFFVYLVGAQIEREEAWGAELTVTLTNQGQPERTVWLSGSAEGRDGWTVTANSADELLKTTTAGKDPTKDTSVWTQDPALRTLTVSYRKE